MFFSEHNVEVGTSHTGTSIITLEKLESSSSIHKKYFSTSVEVEAKLSDITVEKNALLVTKDEPILKEKSRILQ